ncbi:MAG: alpha/beta hydrolase [Bacteroidia bacterium]|nr:alpha/beta hydrolase [Bacteroidia bacterium]
MIKTLFIFSFLMIPLFLFSQYTESKYLEVEGIKIHFRQWKPEGKPKGQILMIHGFCGSTFTWRKNTDSLISQGYEVTAIDLPPFGYSDKRKLPNLSTSFLAGLVWKTISLLGDSTQQWILCGHSMGGEICRTMFFLHPEKVKGIIFIDPAFILFGNPSEFRQKILSNDFVYKLAEVSGKFLFLKKGSIRQILSLKAYSIRPDKEAVLGYRKILNQKGLAGGIARLLGSPQVQEFPNQCINVPCIQIWGKKDRVVSFRKTRKCYHTMPPGTGIYLIAKGGHCPMETHSGEVNLRMSVFLGKLY